MVAVRLRPRAQAPVDFGDEALRLCGDRRQRRRQRGGVKQHGVAGILAVARSGPLRQACGQLRDVGRPDAQERALVLARLQLDHEVVVGMVSTATLPDGHNSGMNE